MVNWIFLYFSDGLRLVKKGNLKLEKSILKAIDSAQLQIATKSSLLHRFQFESGRFPHINKYSICSQFYPSS